MKVSNRDLWNSGLLYGDPTKLGATPPPPKHRNAKPEQSVLTAVLALLRTHPKVAWAARMNSGAYKTPDGRFIRFGFAGCPDIIGQMRSGKILMIECKSEAGRATEEQEAVIRKVVDNGGHAGIARSVEDAIRIVESAPAHPAHPCRKTVI